VLMRYYPSAFKRPSRLLKLTARLVASASAIVGDAFPSENGRDNNRVFCFTNLA
jgi:hypothetical protein